jgi:hypothetical protein
MPLRGDNSISWFGVLRGASEGTRGEQMYKLLLEQEYFDGSTDCHIRLVSRALEALSQQ